MQHRGPQVACSSCLWGILPVLLRFRGSTGTGGGGLWYLGPYASSLDPVQPSVLASSLAGPGDPRPGWDLSISRWVNALR